MTTERSEILREVLDFIETYGGEYLRVLMAEAREEDKPSSTTPEGREQEYHFGEFARSLAKGTAANAASQRTRLRGAADSEPSRHFEEMVQHFSRMGEGGQAFVLEALRKFERERESGSRSGATSSDEDALDDYYCVEVIDRLPFIVRRASQLQPIQVTLSTALGMDLHQYFNEAHHCYLYGFPIACAALCRAMLEAMLIMRVPGKFDDLAERIEEANQRGLLSDEHRVWAYSVKDAGNYAIHNYEKFARGDVSDKMAECLTKTRAIVEELLGTHLQ